MKKILSVLSAIAFMASTSFVACAEGNQTTINANVQATYTVTVPATVSAKSEGSKNLTRDGITDASFGDVTLTKESLFSAGTTVIRATVKGSGASDAFAIKNESNDSIPFTMKDGATALASGGTFDITLSTETEDSVKSDLKYSINGNDVDKVGSYTGTVTFTFEEINT